MVKAGLSPSGQNLPRPMAYHSQNGLREVLGPFNCASPGKRLCPVQTLYPPKMTRTKEAKNERTCESKKSATMKVKCQKHPGSALADDLQMVANPGTQQDSLDYFE